jgi:hypothetical protein
MKVHIQQMQHYKNAVQQHMALQKIYTLSDRQFMFSLREWTGVADVE